MDNMTEPESYSAPEEENPIIECRTCLQIMNAESSFFNIFDGWMPPWDGMENTMAEDLAKLANIEILESDKHSHMMCETCCQVLLTACNFAATVRKNDSILKERYGGLKESDYPVSDRIWPKPIQVDKSLPFENPVDIEIKQEVVSDEECLANGFYEHNRDDMPNLDIVKVEQEEIQQKPIQVQVIENGTTLHRLHTNDIDENKMDCETQLTNGINDNGDDHLDTMVKEEPVSDEEEIDPCVSDLSLECMLCTKIFNSVSGLKAHVIAHHSYKSVKRKCSTSLSPERKKRKYTCAICRRSFSTSTDLMVHETCHNKSVCYGCNESFDTFAQLTKHRRTCKAISSKEVTRPRTLDDVLRPQSKEPTQELKCLLCDEKFTDTYYLNIHQEIHHSADVIQHKNPYKMSLKLCSGKNS